jgi:acyl-coenzyme A thioesterase PaaI-like protein
VLQAARGFTGLSGRDCVSMLTNARSSAPMAPHSFGIKHFRLRKCDSVDTRLVKEDQLHFHVYRTVVKNSIFRLLNATAMFSPDEILEKARTSKFYLNILNWSLSRTIPFNKPHGFRVLEVDSYRLKTLMPYRKSNFNHIRGLHACGLATISEFTTGFLLISSLDMKKYRIIMQRLEMDYHYQGKMDATAEFTISNQWLDEHVVKPLEVQESVVVPCEVKIHDVKGNHLTTGKVYWQIKAWSKVKTKVA